MEPGKAHKSLSGTSVQTPQPVQLVVVLSPTGANLRSRHVAPPRSQPAESVNPNSLAVVMKEIGILPFLMAQLSLPWMKLKLSINVGLH